MEEKKSIKYLLGTISYNHLAGPDPSDVYVEDVVSDSRKIGNNALFVALDGVASDGHLYVDDVLANGCSAIIVERGKCRAEQFTNTGTCVIEVEKSRAVFSEIVAAFYGFPQDKLKFIGITGTNGKTTITYLLEKILMDLGIQVGVIGTVNYRYTDHLQNKHQIPAPFTTPDPPLLQKQLAQMAAVGVEVVIMEVSSHALSQNRLGNIQFDIAVFTNLSHDHLDYHSSMDEYFRAKTLLFSHHLKKSGKAVITYKDCDDATENRWASALDILLNEKEVEYFSCGQKNDAVIKPLEIGIEIDKTRLRIASPAGELVLESPLVGRFNADNIITCLGIAEALKIDLQEAAQSLRVATGAPGRLEKVELTKQEKQKTVIFVDYAHTPDALLNVLKNLKALPHEKLFCVFGCGGDRDVTKRPAMGRIAAEYADVAIVTDDNPRTESSTKILEQITVGVEHGGMAIKPTEWFNRDTVEVGCVVIPERSEAIQKAVRCASVDDIVVIAGKGHEKYQLSNTGKRFFDDCLEAQEALFSWDVESISAALGTKPLHPATTQMFGDISTDSRAVQKDQVFVALKGDNFDGHDYLNKAVASGAGCLIASDTTNLESIDIRPVFKVPDTLESLGLLAKYRRKMIAELTDPVVVGITGSSGKTTVKEMTSAIFEKRWPNCDSAPLNRVLRTSGNFNNLIGLPLSLLPIQLKHRVAVLEMGMNKPGEIARLTEIADPDISCIVNVHGAHLEGLGSINGVAKAKEELFAGTREDGLLVVNLDDEHVAASAAKYQHKKVTYSLKGDGDSLVDVFASDIQCRATGMMSFTLNIGNEKENVELSVPGSHNVANSLAAAAIAHAAGTDVSDIVNGLRFFNAPDKRLQIVQAKSGFSIINDTYNANPASMEAGLATLASMGGQKKIAILGDMLELGNSSGDAHREIGAIAARSGLSTLVLCGVYAEFTANGARNAGLSDADLHVFNDKEDIFQWLGGHKRAGMVKKDSWILIKASRGMQFETLVDQIVDL